MVGEGGLTVALMEVTISPRCGLCSTTVQYRASSFIGTNVSSMVAGWPGTRCTLCVLGLNTVIVSADPATWTELSHVTIMCACMHLNELHVHVHVYIF